MQKRLNILFLSSWYPCKNDPYNGNFVARHAVAVANYANVYVIHACSEEDIKTVEINEFEDKGVNTIIIYYPKIKCNIPIISQIKKYYVLRKLYLKAFIDLINKIGNVHLVHHNVIFPIASIAGYFYKIFKIPFVITEHWTGYLPANSKKLPLLTLKLSRTLSKQAAFILPVSNNLGKSMQKLGIKGNYKVVPNVVDSNLFSLKEPVHSPIRFIHVSTLKDNHKNVSGILRAIKALSLKRTDFNVLIVGDGDIKPHIKYAEELNLQENIVQIEGAKPIEEIANLMSQSDVFLLFSNYENSPCVISEALCTGLSVISSDVGGINEMIDDSNGILIKPGNEKTLCNKMSYIIDNFMKYDSKKIRDNAVKKYSYEKIGKQFIDIYQEVIKR
jgi:L-malate glycosyltransferase